MKVKSFLLIIVCKLLKMFENLANLVLINKLHTLLSLYELIYFNMADIVLMTILFFSYIMICLALLDDTAEPDRRQQG